jgi:hypothetical protein
LLLKNSIVYFDFRARQLIHKLGLSFAPIGIFPLQLGIVFTQVKVLGEVVFPYKDLNCYIVVGSQELIARKTQVSDIPTERQNLQHSKDQEDPETLQKSDEIAHKNKDSKFDPCYTSKNPANYVQKY